MENPMDGRSSVAVVSGSSWTSPKCRRAIWYTVYLWFGTGPTHILNSVRPSELIQEEHGCVHTTQPFLLLQFLEVGNRPKRFAPGGFCVYIDISFLKC